VPSPKLFEKSWDGGYRMVKKTAIHILWVIERFKNFEFQKYINLFSKLIE